MPCSREGSGGGGGGGTRVDFCWVCVACVAWRFWLGALSNKGGRGQRDREEIGAEATSRALRARILLLRRSCARLNKTAMLRRLGYVPLASQSPYLIIVYFVAIYRPHLSYFWANM